MYPFPEGQTKIGRCGCPCVRPQASQDKAAMQARGAFACRVGPPAPLQTPKPMPMPLQCFQSGTHNVTATRAQFGCGPNTGKGYAATMTCFVFTHGESGTGCTLRWCVFNMLSIERGIQVCHKSTRQTPHPLTTQCDPRTRIWLTLDRSCDPGGRLWYYSVYILLLLAQCRNGKKPKGKMRGNAAHHRRVNIW